MRAPRTILLFAASSIAAACAGNPEPAANPTPAPTPSATAIPAPVAQPAPAKPTADDAAKFIARVDRELRDLNVDANRAAWVHDNFITRDTEKLSATTTVAVSNYLTKTIKEASRFDGVDLPPDIARKLRLLKLASSLTTPSDPEKAKELSDIAAAMEGAYGSAKYCKPGGKCLDMNQIEEIVAKSKNWDELLDLWKGWHAIGAPMRAEFARYVELDNEGAREIGFSDVGAKWRSGYDMSPEDFERDTDRLWGEVKPLYDDLHCYVRKELRKRYGKDKVPEHGPIPAHILGNLWAQEWNNLYDSMVPYPKEPPIDITKTLAKKKMAPEQMVRIGEAFFTSMGMDPLPKTFWERSLFVRPRDRDVECHASAWDVETNNDLRIKMCIHPTEEDLVTIHHELGHDYYYHYYKDLPFLYSDAPNDGFHEGIGDAIALAMTPAYLKQLGFLDKIPDSDKGDINYLFKQALERVAFLPFGLLIDKWRWDVFAGRTKPSDYEKAWWSLRLAYQGVAPPLPRTESDFDPGAKYHVAANVPYMRYFLARIYQFQFYRALCRAAGHTGPLYKCSFFGSKAAGDRFKAMLALGASRPWQEALEALSGERRGDAGALLEYFAPLRKWLEEQNNGERCGW